MAYPAARVQRTLPFASDGFLPRLCWARDVPQMALSLLRSAPFFEDKNRAFWTLQSVGWTGYFVLRALSTLVF